MEATTTPAGAKKPPHPLPWLNLLVTEPFYLLHFLAFFSYFVARSSATEILSSPELYHRLLRREIQAIIAFLVLTVVKMVKQESWEAFVADILFYAKLESLLTEGSTSRFWLVEFRNQCSSKCVRTSRFLPELSITYSNKNISFGIVDLGHFPNAAEKFGISLGGVLGTGQLPTFILFDHAVEVTRFPEFTFDSNPSTPKVTKSILCRHFELDQRLIEYVSGK